MRANNPRLTPPTKEMTVLSNVETGTVGLCSTCENAGFCVYRSMRGGDAQFCELYTRARSADSANPDDGTDRTADAARPPESGPGNGRVRGLCVNCLHRGSCALPKPPGGIWHCDDYE